MTDDETTGTELVLERSDVQTADVEVTATVSLTLHDHDLTSAFDVEADDITNEYAKRVAKNVVHAYLERELGASTTVATQTFVDADEPRTTAAGLTARDFDVAVLGADA